MNRGIVILTGLDVFVVDAEGFIDLSAERGIIVKTVNKV